MSCLSENVSVAVRVSVSVNENPRISADTIVVQHNDGNPSILSLSLFLCPSVSLNISAACIAFFLSSRAEMRNMIPVYLNLV